jgi:uncharacterized protein (TIGR03382 family)
MRSSHTKTTLSALALSVGLIAPGISSAQSSDDLIDWGDYEGVEGLDDDAVSGSSISEAETTFKGAQMLTGEIDVDFEEVTVGMADDTESLRYAFFSGNTIYAGVEDRDGNTIDMIAEFFWFESSIDRGSDFWVAVVKARTSPNLEGDWMLEMTDSPILSVQAETMNEDRNAGFRWDWSVPFESYGWDAYGNVTLETVYGIGSAAEGSALVAYEDKTSEDGVTSEVRASIQSKGYFNSEYRVQTRYQVTLWRWEMFVHGTPQDLSWDLYLDSPDRQEQNAYHEYFIVMQADEDKGFSLDRLQLSGTVTNPRWYWWDEHSTMSIALNNIQIERPESAWDNWDGGDENEAPEVDEDEDDVEEIDESDDGDDATDEDNEDDGSRSGDSTTINVTIPGETGGCSTSGTGTGPLGLVMGLGLALFGRRRD